jgi:thiol:disulfide interchange protein
MRRTSLWAMVLVLAAAGAATVGCGGGAGSSGSSSATAAGAAALPWEQDLPKALARASGEKKLVMVDFYTDWCRWCKRMDQTTFADANVQRALRRVVSVKLNAEKDGRAAAARFSVDGYPTIVFLNARGGEVGRIPGYLEPGPFLEELEDILKRA